MIQPTGNPNSFADISEIDESVTNPVFDEYNLDHYQLPHDDQETITQFKPQPVFEDGGAIDELNT